MALAGQRIRVTEKRRPIGDRNDLDAVGRDRRGLVSQPLDLLDLTIDLSEAKALREGPRLLLLEMGRDLVVIESRSVRDQVAQDCSANAAAPSVR